MNKWYNMTANGAEAEVSLFGEIGWEVNAQAFANDLKAMGDVGKINLRINSGGGSITEGTAIFNTILRHPAKVTAYVEGWAASMASVIAMAADEIIIPENAWMVIHNPWGGVSGEAEDLRKHADLLDRMKATIVEAYMRHAKVSREEIVRMMDDETWMSGAEAVQFGFATATATAIQAAASVREGFAKMPEAARSLFGSVEPPPVAAPVEPEPEPAPVEPAPEPPKEPEPPAPDPEKEQLAAENARLSDELAKVKNDLRILVEANGECAREAADLEVKNAALELQLTDAKNHAKDMQNRLSKTTGGMGATEDQGGVRPAVIDEWKSLVARIGYEDARKKHPEKFAAFRAAYAKK